MNKRSVYLGGPITGLDHDKARYGWRQKFIEALPEIECFSPMRATCYLKDKGVIDTTDHPKEEFIVSDSGIVARDANDIFMTDATVVCFLDAAPGVISIGTCIEIGLAYAKQKPLILIAHPDDQHRKHPMIRQMAGYTVSTLEDGIKAVRHLLCPSL